MIRFSRSIIILFSRPRDEGDETNSKALIEDVENIHLFTRRAVKNKFVKVYFIIKLKFGFIHLLCLFCLFPLFICCLRVQCLLVYISGLFTFLTLSLVDVHRNLYETHRAESTDKHEPVPRLINSLDNIRIIVG